MNNSNNDIHLCCGQGVDHIQLINAMWTTLIRLLFLIQPLYLSGMWVGVAPSNDRGKPAISYK